jgi:hypothetical protein
MKLVLNPLLGLILFLSLSRVARGDDVQITVLHTNDVHGHIEMFDKYGKMCDETTRNELCYGGVAKRYTEIQRIRQNEKNVLLLDAGDEFQGISNHLQSSPIPSNSIPILAFCLLRMDGPNMDGRTHLILCVSMAGTLFFTLYKGNVCASCVPSYNVIIPSWIS